MQNFIFSPNHEGDNIASAEGIIARISIDEFGCDSPRSYDCNQSILYLVNPPDINPPQEIEGLPSHLKSLSGDELHLAVRDYAVAQREAKSPAHIVMVVMVYKQSHIGFKAVMDRRTAPYPYNCKFDSAIAGFAFAPATLAEPYKVIEQEVDYFSQWANGEHYCVRVEANGEVIDACAGYIGYDYAETEASRMLAGALAAKHEASREAWQNHRLLLPASAGMAALGR